MGTCLGCGAELTKRHQVSFCSNACQRARERRELLEQWLATGEGKPHANGQSY